MLEPVTKDVPPQTVISMQHTGPYGEIGNVYHRLHEWARKRNLNVTGKGLTVFLSPPGEFDQESAIFEVCLPVDTLPSGDSEVSVKKLPPVRVAAVQVKGPYEKIPAHYTEMLAWLNAQGLEIAGPPREVYIKRPDVQGGGGPEEFITEIQFPIRE